MATPIAKKHPAAGKRLRADKRSLGRRLGMDIRKHYQLYLIFLPVLAYYIIFHYIPMYGAIIAFKDFSPSRGILGSEWVGFKHFINFFEGPFFWRIFGNTLKLSLALILIGFPAPILLAILINELRNKRFAKTVQTITYMPHFISLVVLCGMIHQFTKDTGFITQFLTLFGFEKRTMLGDAGLYRAIYVLSDLWQEIGWGSIIYLAALAGIDPQLYEAAKMDGAGRLRQIWHVSLPGITPTIVILFIMRIGRIMSIGAEKTLLLYNPSTYSTSDIISSYVYRQGILNADWSAASAVGLFNSVISFVLLISVNRISKRLTDNSLW